MTKISELPKSVLEDYTERLQAHIEAVQEFGSRIGVPEYQLAHHDDSKYSEAEFVPYAQYFVQFNESPVDKEAVAPAFARAWLHHIHHNPHHWQHWMFADKWSPKGANIENGVMKMPEHYALEMIADWHGASYVYTGSWDIQDWLWQNMPRITLHSETADYIRGVLDMLSYADTVYMQRWAHEPEWESRNARQP